MVPTPEMCVPAATHVNFSRPQAGAHSEYFLQFSDHGGTGQTLPVAWMAHTSRSAPGNPVLTSPGTGRTIPAFPALYLQTEIISAPALQKLKYLSALGTVDCLVSACHFSINKSSPNSANPISYRPPFTGPLAMWTPGMDKGQTRSELKCWLWVRSGCREV